MYDITVIGAGWAGYSAALKAREEGLSVCLIEKEKIGGVCLNSGCIPTKILIHSTKLLSQIKRSENLGISIKDLSFDLKKIKEKKTRIIERLKNGMLSELKRRGIDFINGQAQIVGPNRIRINSKDLETKFIIIAVGASPKELDSLKFDHKRILDSDDILELDDIPKNILIIGGGVIGCEFAVIFENLGTEVTLVEIADQLLPNEDKEISKKLESIFKKKKINIFLKKNFSELNLDEFEKILVCVGRIPNIDALEKIGIKVDKNRIWTDEYLRTSIPEIYACGDCIGGYFLAHVASYQGKKAVENILNKEKRVDYTGIPNCIFTEPEIGSVGLTEEKARDLGYDIEIYKFDFLASGASHIQEETEGFIKILKDIDTDLILGAHIIGPQATEIINILALSIRLKIKSFQLKDLIFGHPTFSETILEAINKWR